MAGYLKLGICQHAKKMVLLTSCRTPLCGVNRTVKSFLGNNTENCHRTLLYRSYWNFTQFVHTGKTSMVLYFPEETKLTVSKGSSYSSSLVPYRTMSQRASARGSSKDRTSVVLYIGAAGIFMLGLGYAGVPLYRMFCQATGYGGSVMVTPGHDASKVEGMEPVKERKITVKFNADTASSMQWKFRPQQPKVELVPGETALAFYTAKNPTDKPVIGISTYNVIPFDAGIYFNKIQCFCFEEQRLNPHEQVDMPVFFFIDPEFAEDPKMEHVDEITLSYTFFEAKEGMTLPLPGYMQPIHQSQ